MNDDPPELLFMIYIRQAKCEGSRVLMDAIQPLESNLYEMHDVTKLSEDRPSWLNGTPIIVDMRESMVYRGSDAIQLIKTTCVEMQRTRRSPPKLMSTRQRRQQQQQSSVSSASSGGRSSHTTAEPITQNQAMTSSRMRIQQAPPITTPLTESSGTDADVQALIARRNQLFS